MVKPALINSSNSSNSSNSNTSTSSSSNAGAFNPWGGENNSLVRKGISPYSTRRGENSNSLSGLGAWGSRLSSNVNQNWNYSVILPSNDQLIDLGIKDINNLLNEGKIQRALEYYVLASDKVKSQTKKKLTQACNKKIAALLEAKEVKEAFPLFESAQQAGIEADSEKLSEPLNRVALFLIKSKEHNNQTSRAVSFSNAAKLFESMCKSPKITVWQATVVAYAIAYLTPQNFPSGNEQIKNNRTKLVKGLIEKNFTTEKNITAELKREFNPFVLAKILPLFLQDPPSMVKFVNDNPYIKEDAVRSLGEGKYEMGVIQRDIFNKTVSFNKENTVNKTVNFIKESTVNKKLEKYENNITSSFTIQALIYNSLMTKEDLTQLTVKTKIDNISKEKQKELKDLKERTILNLHYPNFGLKEKENNLVIKRRN